MTTIEKNGGGAMRFIHTSDLHLGKTIRQQSLLDDQRDMLAQLLRVVKEEKPDAVLIAGDLYDMPVPSTEAVRLLDDFLHQLTVDLKTPVLAIAGNHDGAERLRFGNRLMKSIGYHINGNIQEAFTPVALEDEHGPVEIFLLPFAHVGRVRDYYQLEETPSYEKAYGLMLDHIKEVRNPEARCVVVAHAFVTPGGVEMDMETDAERPFPSIGGVEQVPAELFQSFDYVALGHLHRSMSAGQPHIRYAGSPLKYSIREEHHEKGFLIVDMDAEGQVEVREIPVVPVKDVRTVTGNMKDILQMPMSEDYVYVHLLDQEKVPDAMARIRSVFPYALHVTRAKGYHPFLQQHGAKEDISEKKPMEIIESFFKSVCGESPDEEATRILAEAWEEAGNYAEGDEA